MSYFVAHYLDALGTRLHETRRRINTGKLTANGAVDLGLVADKEALAQRLQDQIAALATPAGAQAYVAAQARVADAKNIDAMRATMQSGCATGDPLALTISELTAMRSNMEAMKK